MNQIYGSMMKTNWHQYFSNIAKQVASRSTCSRAHHGCVLTRDNQILSTGYNGSPPKCDECIEHGCFMIDNHCERCNHAEVNAICQASKSGVPLYSHHSPTIAYITGIPCHECVRTLLGTGIKHFCIPDECMLSWETQFNEPTNAEDVIRKSFIEQSNAIMFFSSNKLCYNLKP